ncbi:Uncharacterised protein [Vibrio cholerae]|nr:Uncharacterised protein [Vibrio cholerae]CSC42794.1 Uncharacterised protein [Vibrio cholerae]CSD48492.1 Uncharacterised protein [Vibrio cholerae]CSI35880.1 Uncharacterised protein [Vibrio cholerae]
MHRFCTVRSNPCWQYIEIKAFKQRANLMSIEIDLIMFT